mmetsp:Transcript_112916/g.364490  ORF Transcript_112916/g.364490 Transcript_112916/m.364490 type:complete len:684 (+) Transcript_112916:3-2054(+)
MPSFVCKSVGMGQDDGGLPTELDASGCLTRAEAAEPPLGMSPTTDGTVDNRAPDGSAALPRLLDTIRPRQLDVALKISGGQQDLWQDAGFSQGEASLTFKDVSFALKTKGGDERLILASISGHFRPGSLVAVMGPSGSGKTTLLDILAGKKAGPFTGTVHFNGRPQDRLYPRMIAYVPQDDVLPAHLTVKEAVLFHDSLKEERPSEISWEVAARLTERRLEALGLAEVQDSLIGDECTPGISGGQRRRLSLARGLSAAPHIIFCDEPTSGLSATDAEACVRYMRELVDKRGVTIVAVIHQPRVEVTRLFSHLLLLTALPGRTVYNGPMEGVERHWARAGFPVPAGANPLDYCMDLVTPRTPGSQEEALVAFYDAHCRPASDELVRAELHSRRSTPLELLERRRRALLRFGRLPPVRSSRYGVRFGLQLRVLFSRQLTLSLRDKQGVLADMLVAVVKAAVVGVAYMDVGSLAAQHQCGFFFMVLMTCSLDGMKHMPKIIGERAIMKMETSDALYSEWAYILTFTVINGIQMLLAHSLFVVLLFSLSGLTWEIFGCLYLWSTILAITMDSLYLMVAAIAKDSSSAQVLSLPMLMFLLLYNGFLAARTTVPGFMAWAIAISPVAYAMEAVVIAAARASSGSMYQYTIEAYGYTDELGLALGVMCAYLLSFRFIQIVSLKKLNNIRR